MKNSDEPTKDKKMKVEEKIKLLSTLILTLLIPLVIAIIGSQFNRAVKERDVQAKFVELGVEILSKEPDPETKNIRMWATEIINKYSGVPLNDSTKNDLIERIPLTTLSGLSSDIIIKSTDEELNICTFNIQFLGHFKKKDNESLAKLLSTFDIVVLQELVAPPFPGTYPDGTKFFGDKEAGDFFGEMQSVGFNYFLSSEDTGSGDRIHLATPATEWWVSFYKPEKVKIANDLPTKFLSDDRSNNENYCRVPHSFGFRTVNNELDFVLISVHLPPGRNKDKRARRRMELLNVVNWIRENNDVEKDFIILGDMNVIDVYDLDDITPPGFISLNDEFRLTGTSRTKEVELTSWGHVFINQQFTINDIDVEFDCQTVNLITQMEKFWKSSVGPYPGNPYVHNEFRQYYSDQNPVVFKMILRGRDDD